MSARLKPYPSYRDSGVEWLGRIAAHWQVKRLKFAAPACDAKLAEKPHGSTYVGLENIESKTGRLLLDALVEIVDSTVVTFRRGDVLFGKLRPYLAKVARPNFDGVGTTELLVLRPLNGLDAQFLTYRLLAPDSIELINSFTYGVKMPRASGEQVGNLAIAWPTLAEQQSIANFLDRETGKIDSLVKKKDRLIELLQEKRTALVNHAVTKGLNPNAPMKDSGVEWLGHIPKHWAVSALKRNWEVVDCKHRTVPFVLEGVPLASIGEVQSVNLDLSNANRTTHDEYSALIEGGRCPKRGDVIYSRNATVGAAAYVNTDAEFCMGQDVCLIRSPANDQRFLVYQLRSPVVMQQLDSLALGVTFKRINVEQIKDLTLCCPPAYEQKEISAYLDRETAKLDALMAKVRTAIERLEEYRTALISAAVTGQIDVRRQTV